MPLRTTDWAHGEHVGGYDVVIDVRTPAEWEDDHVPGAINLPVLDHDQRHQVGVTYKNNSFEGKKLGASLIADSISKIIQSHFMDKPQTYKPLIYCWRGGKRSGSLALVLEQIGFKASVLEGGYKAYRTQVQANLASIPPSLEWRVLTGPTGSGKTEILHHMRAHGHQVLDLEGLAKHRGSVLGSWDEAQPSQKNFESLLHLQLIGLDAARPVWVEDEASVIGKIHVPKLFFEAMMPATRYEVALPLDVRVRHLMAEYTHLVHGTAELKRLLDRLRQHQGHARVDAWHAMIDSGDMTQLVEELLSQHYDPANARSIQARLGKYQPRYMRIALSALDSAALTKELPEEMFLPQDQQTQTTSAADHHHWFHKTALTGFNQPGVVINGTERQPSSRQQRRGITGTGAGRAPAGGVPGAAGAGHVPSKDAAVHRQDEHACTEETHGGPSQAPLTS